MDTLPLFSIAGLAIRLHDLDGVLADLRALYAAFQQRGDAFIAAGRNPHLCRAGCSHCCMSGAIFAVTLAEAVQWSRAIAELPDDGRARILREARVLAERQAKVFFQDTDLPDVPGRRDETVFSARVARLARTGPACPLLAGDLCATYASRPLLCRAYGFPVDAYAVEGGDSLVFRSLCVLYAGRQLTDYVRARDLKLRLTELSRRIAGGRDYGRFTSIEAICARIIPASEAR